MMKGCVIAVHARLSCIHKVGFALVAAALFGGAHATSKPDMNMKKKKPDFNDIKHEAADRVTLVRAIIASNAIPIERNFLIAKMCQTGTWKGQIEDARFFLAFLLQNGLIDQNCISD